MKVKVKTSSDRVAGSATFDLGFDLSTICILLLTLAGGSALLQDLRQRGLALAQRMGWTGAQGAPYFKKSMVEKGKIPMEVLAPL